MGDLNVHDSLKQLGEAMRRAIRRAMLCAGLMLPALPATSAEFFPLPVQASQEQGYARLVFRFTDRPDAAAIVSNGVLIVRFAQPVDVNVDAVPGALKDYVTAAKRDPDGMALRFALSRRLTASSMAVGDLLFVDLLPQGWRGFPPPVPVEALTEVTLKARRVAAAEAELRRMRQQPHRPLIVRAGTYPTFFRMVFELSQPLDMVFAREGERVNVRVNANVPFDPLSVRPVLPEGITQFRTDRGDDFVNVSFHVEASVDVRSFREGNSLIVDIMRPQEGAEPPPAGVKPEDLVPTVPVPSEPAAPAAAPASPAAAPRAALRQEPDTTGSIGFAPFRAGGLLALRTGMPHLVKVQNPAPAASTAVPVRMDNGKDTLTLTFGFQQPTPAAAFRRGNTLWVVFDGGQAVTTEGLVENSGGLIKRVRQIPTDEGLALLIDLAEPRLTSLDYTSEGWKLALSNTLSSPVTPLAMASSFDDNGMSHLQVTLEGMGKTHWLQDPDAGDRMAAVTALPPSRGMIRARDLLELRVLPSAQGLVIQPLADDLRIAYDDTSVLVGRPDGLSLSTITEGQADNGPFIAPPAGQSPYNTQAWESAQKMPFEQRSEELLRVVAGTNSDAEKLGARQQLADFYLARGQYSDAKAVQDVIRADAPQMKRDPKSALLYASTLINLRQYDDALKELNTGQLANNPVAALWRSVAETELGRFGRAREAFQKGAPALTALPVDVQNTIRLAAVQSAVDSKDFAAAQVQLDALETLSPLADAEKRQLLRGRMAQAMGQNGLALEMYGQAMTGTNEEIAAHARLWSSEMRMESGELKGDAAITAMESLATGWRGDDVEGRALAHLATLYVEHERWRDAFTAMRTAVQLKAQSELTRKVQNDMSTMFAQLFLGQGEHMAPPTLDSVALFYDFKELTPPGRNGDEMIRQLADRLADVDLLDSAAELLDYQINYRLQGAARAQVAARAALFHLMNHNPTAAYRILQTTRQANLPMDLVRNRLLLEARALSELGRTDLALDMLTDYEGSDVLQLRADILWHAKRWQLAAESLELSLGNRWQGDEALDDNARQNVMRTAIAYVQARDNLGLERFRAKYAAKMADGPDAKAFEVITAATAERGADFDAVSEAVVASDMMQAFLTEYRKRYPASALPAETPPAPAGQG
jgi:hypothetical protein